MGDKFVLMLFTDCTCFCCRDASWQPPGRAAVLAVVEAAAEPSERIGAAAHMDVGGNPEQQMSNPGQALLPAAEADEAASVRGAGEVAAVRNMREREAARRAARQALEERYDAARRGREAAAAAAAVAAEER